MKLRDIVNTYHENEWYLAHKKDVDFELKSFECDGHWNDETHRNIANTIFKNNFLK